MNRFVYPKQSRGILGYSVTSDEDAPELAMIQLNRKMRGVIKKIKDRDRGYQAPTRRRYFAKRKSAQRESFKRIQTALAQIAIERNMSAQRKKADRRRAKMEEADPSLARNEYLEAIMEGRVPPDLEDI